MKVTLALYLHMDYLQQGKALFSINYSKAKRILILKNSMNETPRKLLEQKEQSCGVNQFIIRYRICIRF